MDIHDFRVMVIGAHPDDPDIRFGGTAAKLARKGARVRFVSAGNGKYGHHLMDQDELCERRHREMAAAAKVFGVESYTTMGLEDCEIEPTIENRRKMVRLIRSFAPHFVFTHRPCDYHADHRAVSQLVTDASYLLGVAKWCPEVPRPDVLPCVWYLPDNFTSVDGVLRNDLSVNVDDVVEQMFDAISCHVSQVFEWLPYDQNIVDKVPKDWATNRKARNEYLEHLWLDPLQRTFARRYNLPCVNAEVFELSEYGRKPTIEELAFFT